MFAANALQLRVAYKALDKFIETEESMATLIKDSNACDLIEIHANIENGRDPILCLIAEGKTVAHIPVTDAMLKRLKREMGFWGTLKSGSRMGFRHGNRC